MVESFELVLTEDVEKAVERAKTSAQNSGSTFHGDRFAGMFRGKGIEGYYRVDGQTVIVTVTEKPSVLPLSIIEAAFRNYFGVGEATGEPPVDPGVYKSRSLKPRAKDLVRRHALYASGAGLVPVPLADVAAVTAVQVKMLLELTELYEVSYSRSALREFATALTGSAAARLGASALKAVPGLGSLIGGASMSIMSGASTYAVGIVTIDELENGREIGAASDRMKQAYKEAYEEGKELIDKVKAKATGERRAPVGGDSDEHGDNRRADSDEPAEPATDAEIVDPE